jgi:hypothetical protein
MKNSKDKNYVFTTSINTSENQDEFLIELFSCSEEESDQKKPEKVIHDFDELISFFESLDQEIEVSESKVKLIGQK